MLCNLCRGIGLCNFESPLRHVRHLSLIPCQMQKQFYTNILKVYLFIFSTGNIILSISWTLLSQHTHTNTYMPQCNWENQKYTQPVLQLIVEIEYIVSMLYGKLQRTINEGFMFKSNRKKDAATKITCLSRMHLKRVFRKI